VVSTKKRLEIFSIPEKGWSIDLSMNFKNQYICALRSKKDKLTVHIEELTEKMKSQMPRIKEEIRIYERKVAAGTQTISPKVSPQFN